MLFHSFPYLPVFLPIVASVHALLEKHTNSRITSAWLLGASLYFYSYGAPGQVILLAGSIVFNWLIARQMCRLPESERKRVLQIGLVVNIVFLCSFKYVNFLLRSLPGFSSAHILIPDWAAPLGLSFFTLTQVMYLVDTYQGLNRPNSLFDHATMVSLFPYISSGPLVAARSIIPQLNRTARKSGQSRVEMACRGIYLLAIGLVKKVALADAFAAVANAGFGRAQSYSTLEAWVFSSCYSLQIYFDFSGYSDMAVGSAWLLGIDIPANFNSPYRSKSISEFWQRWHISLSNFITSYLYTPMLRSMGKATLSTSVAATLLAMAIAGLWHGPGWCYIIFGLLHGIGLAANQIWKKRKKRMPDGLSWTLTFLLVNTAFIFFRSPDAGSALRMISALVPQGNLLGAAALKGVIPFTPMLIVRPVVVGAVLAFFFRNSVELAREFRPTPWTLCGATALMVLAFYYMNSTTAKQFVYFAF